MLYSKDKKPYVPDGWVACWAENRHMWYYGNKWTQESQWNPPEGSFFPKENECTLCEHRVQDGAERFPFNDLRTNPSSKQNENITSNCHQKLPQLNEAKNSATIISKELFEFPQPASKMTNTQKVIVMLIPFLLTGGLVFFARPTV